MATQRTRRGREPRHPEGGAIGRERDVGDVRLAPQRDKSRGIRSPHWLSRRNRRLRRRSRRAERDVDDASGVTSELGELLARLDVADAGHVLEGGRGGESRTVRIRVAVVSVSIRSGPSRNASTSSRARPIVRPRHARSRRPTMSNRFTVA